MKVFFDTVGCRLNQAEIEEMAGKLRQAGHEIMSKSEDADTVIINSCAVTAAASSDSRQKVRQAHHNGIDNIILTGCWATLYPQQAAALEGVASVVNNIEKMNIPAQLIPQWDEMIDIEPISRRPIPGVHHRTRAFIRVQDGCDNFCTYCVTRLARGKAHSILKDEILCHLNEAVAGGAKEAVLTGVNLGSWGEELDGTPTITQLLDYLLNHSEVERIRLSSLEPWDIMPSFFELWQSSRMCSHLHLPLQSGSKSVLQRMARNTTPEKFRDLVEIAKSKIPDVAITTDVIVGFPGETDQEFEESLAFVKEMNFSGGHVFRYSRREGTAAATYPLQISGKTAIDRARRMRETLESDEREFIKSQLNKDVHVLWEACNETSPGTWQLEGYSENYIRVRAVASENRWNHIDVVKANKVNQKVMLGEIVQYGH